MKILEYDMNEVEYIKNLLLECNQVNKALLDGRIDELSMAKCFMKDNVVRINSCLQKLSNLHKSMSEYEVSK